MAAAIAASTATDQYGFGSGGVVQQPAAPAGKYTSNPHDN